MTGGSTLGAGVPEAAHFMEAPDPLLATTSSGVTMKVG